MTKETIVGFFCCSFANVIIHNIVLKNKSGKLTKTHALQHEYVQGWCWQIKILSAKDSSHAYKKM